MTDFKFYAFFTATKQGVPGLVVTTDVYNSAGALVVNGAASSEIGGGLYTYTHSTALHDDFTAIFKTADLLVDCQHLPSLAVKQIAEMPGSVWDELLAPHVIVGSAGAKLSCIPCLGSGSVHWLYTVTESDNVTPVPYALVQVSTDIAGTDLVAAGYTDALGRIWFDLDSGTYYLWISKVGYSAINPDTEVVP